MLERGGSVGGGFVPFYGRYAAQAGRPPVPVLRWPSVVDDPVGRAAPAPADIIIDRPDRPSSIVAPKRNQKRKPTPPPGGPSGSSSSRRPPRATRNRGPSRLTQEFSRADLQRRASREQGRERGVLVRWSLSMVRGPSFES